SSAPTSCWRPTSPCRCTATTSKRPTRRCARAFSTTCGPGCRASSARATRQRRWSVRTSWERSSRRRMSVGSRRRCSISSTFGFRPLPQVTAAVAQIVRLGQLDGELNDRLLRLAYAVQLLDDAVAEADRVQFDLAAQLATLHQGTTSLQARADRHE